jgi:hypothetical protein
VGTDPFHSIIHILMWSRPRMLWCTSIRSISQLSLSTFNGNNLPVPNTDSHPSKLFHPSPTIRLLRLEISRHPAPTKRKDSKRSSGTTRVRRAIHPCTVRYLISHRNLNVSLENFWPRLRRWTDSAKHLRGCDTWGDELEAINGW